MEDDGKRVMDRRVSWKNYYNIGRALLDNVTIQTGAVRDER